MPSLNNFQKVITKMVINIPEIPHGHGGSFKEGVILGESLRNELPNDDDFRKGFADGLRNEEKLESSDSYMNGYALGESLKGEIAKKVKPSN